MTESEIIELYHSGRTEDAFKGIVDTYSERLYWHVRRFLCSHEDTNDLLQDIYIKIWTALPTFRGESQIFTWLWRIATNEVLNYLRKQKFKAMVSLDSSMEILRKKIDDDPYFNGNELQRELHKAIQKLPEKQRITVHLKDIEGYSTKEVAEILETDESNVRTILSRSRKALREIIEKEFGYGI